MAAKAGIAYVEVRGDFGPFNRQLATTGRSLGSGFNRMGRDLGAQLTRGATVAVKAGAVGIAGGLGYAVKKAADFEGQLSSLGSVSNATAKQMERLRKQAMRAGADTKYSALEAAQAQTELAKGGLSVQQMLKGGLNSSLALAAAGEMDLADAAATTVNAMKLFNLRGKDAMSVADGFASAANNTTADVKDFALALTQGGSAAKAVGFSFQETTAALEALAEGGVKGSDAGTSLKSALIQLAAPTDKASKTAQGLGLNFFKANGEMKSLTDVSGMLRDKLGGLTREERVMTATRLAGTDGFRALLALYDAGPKKLAKYQRDLNKQGTAERVAAKKQDNLKGSMEQLSGSIETLGISVGTKMIPTLRRAADDVTDFTNKVNGILDKDGLTFGEKMDRIFGEAKIAAGPWVKDIREALKDADIPKLLADAVSAATPALVKGVALAAPKAAGAFVHAFNEANVWGKLVIGGLLLKKLGGLRSLGGGAAGGLAGGLLKSRGATPANPLFVAVVGGGVPGAPIGGAPGGKTGKLAKLGKVAKASPLGIPIIAGGAIAAIGNRGQRDVQDSMRNLGGNVEVLKRVREQLQSIKGLKAFDDLNASYGRLLAKFRDNPVDFGVKNREELERLATTVNDLSGSPLQRLNSRVGESRAALDASTRALANLRKGSLLYRVAAAGQEGAEKRLTAATRERRQHIINQVRSTGDVIRSITDLTGKTQAFQRLARQGVDVRINDDVTARGAKQVLGHFHDMRRLSGADVDRIENKVKTGTRIVRRTLGSETAAGKQALAQNFRLAAAAVKDSMDAGVTDTRRGSSLIKQYLRQGLAAMGIKGKAADRLIVAESAVGDIVSIVNSVKKARGGLVQYGHAGQAGRDTIPTRIGGTDVMVGAGEVAAVFNRHQLPEANARFADVGGLPGFFARNRRPHYAARGGIVPVPGSPGELANSSILDEIAAVKKRYPGLVLTDAYGQGHTSPGHTQTGTAADFSGPDSQMDSAVKALVAQGYLVGYDGRFGSQNWPGHGPSTRTSNFHFHVEFGGNGSIGSLAPVKAPDLKQVLTSLPGGPGALANRALQIQHAGAQGIVKRVADALNSVAQPVAGGTGGVNGRYGKTELAQLWTQAGGPPDVANLMAAIALAESNGDPNIVNSIGATGLWQIHPGGSQYLDPLKNAKTAVSKYRTQGLAAWEAYTNGRYRQFLNRGGLVAKLARGGLVGRDGLPKVQDAPALRKIIARFEKMGHRGLPYIYGGGHGSFSTGLGGYDCSGYVSNGLGPEVLSAPMAVREPMAGALKRGAGKYITVGIRGTSGRNAHTMAHVLDRFYESGSGHGPRVVNGWSGAFDMFHPALDDHLARQFDRLRAKPKQMGATVLPGGTGILNPGATGGPASAKLGRGVKGLGRAIRKGKALSARDVIARIRKIGLPEGLAKRLQGAETNSNTWQAFADAASQLTFDPDTAGLEDLEIGELQALAQARGIPTAGVSKLQLISDLSQPIQGVFRGGRELDWLVARLGGLLQWRNTSIEAEGITVRRRNQTSGLIDTTKGRLTELRKLIAGDTDSERDLTRQLEDARDPKPDQGRVRRLKRELEEAQKHPSRNKQLIKDLKAQLAVAEDPKPDKAKLDKLREQLNRVQDRLRSRTRLQTSLRDKVLPSLITKRSGLADLRGTLLSNLESLQGPGGPLDVLQTLPPVGTSIGGEILATQLRVAELAKSPPKVTDDSADTSTDTGTDDSGGGTETSTDTSQADQAALLQQLLDQERMRYQVSQAQYNVLRYAGKYHDGGVVRGRPGEEVAAVLQAGEIVTPAGQLERTPNAGGDGGGVTLVFENGMEWLRQFVRLEAEGVNRGQARRGARVLPGRAGVIA